MDGPEWYAHTHTTASISGNAFYQPFGVSDLCDHHALKYKAGQYGSVSPLLPLLSGCCFSLAFRDDELWLNGAWNHQQHQSMVPQPGASVCVQGVWQCQEPAPEMGPGNHPDVP